jgi:hypothetical protein
MRSTSVGSRVCNMKRSWFSSLLIAGVIGVLTLFLGLQYMWLTEISEANRERIQKRVETDTARFAEDFDREMQAAYYNFQTPASMLGTIFGNEELSIRN